MDAGGVRTHVIIDFDSTFVQVESLDELARLALEGAPDRERRVANTEWITREGMEGRIGFGESLERRLDQFEPRRAHLGVLVGLLRDAVSPSVRRHRWLVREHADDIWIVSGGFGEWIRPVVGDFGIAADHVLANELVWGDDGLAHGCDRTLALAHDGGKARAVRGLGLEGRVVMVGDGATDLEVREAEAADVFVAYTETVDRPRVSLRADVVARDFGTVARAAGWL